MVFLKHVPEKQSQSDGLNS